MDRFGKWGLRVAVTIMVVLLVNTMWRLYAEATPLQIEHLTATLWATFRLILIASGAFSIGLLAALFYWASRAPKLEQKARKEIHDATED